MFEELPVHVKQNTISVNKDDLCLGNNVLLPITQWNNKAVKWILNIPLVVSRTLYVSYKERFKVHR